MKNSNLYSGEFACLEKANVDTDQIIPKQFLKSISKTDWVLIYSMPGDF